MRLFQQLNSFLQYNYKRHSIYLTAICIGIAIVWLTCNILFLTLNYRNELKNNLIAIDTRLEAEVKVFTVILQNLVRQIEADSIQNNPLAIQNLIKKHRELLLKNGKYQLLIGNIIWYGRRQSNYEVNQYWYRKNGNTAFYKRDLKSIARFELNELGNLMFCPHTSINISGIACMEFSLSGLKKFATNNIIFSKLTTIPKMEIKRVNNSMFDRIMQLKSLDGQIAIQYTTDKFQLYSYCFTRSLPGPTIFTAISTLLIMMIHFFRSRLSAEILNTEKAVHSVISSIRASNRLWADCYNRLQPFSATDISLTQTIEEVNVE